jgi:asparagine synthase (glutamine-hydrolysing)
MSTHVPLIASQAVPIVGGVMSANPVAAFAETLHAMGAAVARNGVKVYAGNEPVGFFVAGPVRVEQSGDVLVVAEGDLLNLRELQDHLGASVEEGGILSELYRREGALFGRRLRGAFAIALWDRRDRTLVLAVDHFGIRRMYYAADHGSTSFASRLSALRARSAERGGIDPAAIYSYLNFGFVPAPQTPYSGIRRLPPGHVLLARAGYTKVEPFWDMSYVEEKQPEDRAAAAVYRLSHQAVVEALQESTTATTGAFLSGGTDSSTVVGLMSRATGERVTCFSIGFDDNRYDELHYAEVTARHFSAMHQTRIVTPNDALEALPALVDAYDEPLGNNSAIGTFLCARMAREHGVACLLAGDGGDEIFGGNERYRTDQVFALYGKIPAPIRRFALEPSLLRLPQGMAGVLGKAQRYIQRAKIPNPRRFYSYEFYVAQNAESLLEGDFLARVGEEGPWSVVERHFEAAGAASELNRLMYVDLKLTIGDNDLFKVVRTGELAGINVRFPFLALPLVEFTGTLPVRFKVRGLEKRYLFKRAFRGLLPRETLTKRKHGFGVPTAVWLRSHRGIREMAFDVLLDGRATWRGHLKPGVLPRLFELHDGEPSAFYGDIIWSLLMLELWYRRHAEREA